MKRILPLPLLAFILLYSCKTSEFSNGTFTKRKYRKGCHVNLKHYKQERQQAVKLERVKDETQAAQFPERARKSHDSLKAMETNSLQVPKLTKTDRRELRQRIRRVEEPKLKQKWIEDPEKERTDDMAILAGYFGYGALILFPLAFVFGPLAIIFGSIGLASEDFRADAIIGIVLGIIGIAIFLILLFIIAAFGLLSI